MSLVARLSRGAGLVPSKSADAGGTVIEQLFGGMIPEGTDAGQTVTIPKALSLPPVFKAIRLISETAGALPLISYRKQSETKRDRLTDSSAYHLLHDEPNEDQDSIDFWTTLLAHLEGWGKFFIGKEFRGRQLSGLHIIEPSRMTVERLRDGRIVFKERRREGGSRTYSRREIIYVKLFSLDGVTGISPIGLQRETVGFSLAMRKQGAKFFADAQIPGGVLQVKEEIKNPDVKDRLRKEWRDRHHGRRDIAVLDAGAEYQQVSVSMADAQYVELAGLTRTDIADMFNMPASMLSGSTGDSMTYGNRVGDRQAFLTFTLHNPLKKIEQALSNDRDLFPDSRDYCEFLREDLLQPDPKGKADIYRLALDPKWGWMRREEVRARENLPAEEKPPDQGDL